MASILSLAGLFIFSESHQSDAYSPKHFQRMFCNKFHGQDLGSGFALADLADHSGNLMVDFNEQCMQCKPNMICPSSAMYVRALPAQWQEPLCCEVKSLCTRPTGMTQTSCTANGLESAVPLLGMFVDSVVVWGDAWQQIASGSVHKLMVIATKVASSLAFGKTVANVETKKLQDAIGTYKQLLSSLSFLWSSIPNIYVMKVLNDLLQAAEQLVSIKQEVDYAKKVLAS